MMSSCRAMWVLSGAAMTLCGAMTLQDTTAAPDAPAAPPAKTAYLTFDDGPSSVTLAILDVLKEYDVPATFFVCGNVTAFGRSAYNRILDEGHALGNHTFSHRYDKIYATAEAFERDVTRLDDLIFKFTGTRPRLFRFPGGSNNRIAKNTHGKSLVQALVNRISRKGYQYFDWNVDSLDYSANAGDADAIADAVVHGVAQRDRAIVLMHDSYRRAATADALPRIIAELRAKGYTFDRLSSESFAVQFLKPEPAE